MKKIIFLNLKLVNFRNYDKQFFEFSGKPVVIYGENGVGKTNLLEALSYFSPGKGFKNISASSALNQNNDHKNWLISAKIDSCKGIEIVDIDYSLEKDKKICKINGQLEKKFNVLAEHCQIFWHLPASDLLFLGAREVRRKYFDRVVYNFYPIHAENVIKYEYYQRERLNFLKNKNRDQDWLSVIEAKLADYACKITEAREKVKKQLNQFMPQANADFPKGEIIFTNFQYEELSIDYFKQSFQNNRIKDEKMGRSNFGPHKFDFTIYYNQKEINAENASTGEQKLLLLSFLIAQIEAKKQMSNFTPIILLDEIASHIDEFKLKNLFQILIDSEVQFFVTTTSKENFEFLGDKVDYISLVKERQLVASHT